MSGHDSMLQPRVGVSQDIPGLFDTFQNETNSGQGCLQQIPLSDMPTELGIERDLASSIVGNSHSLAF